MTKSETLIDIELIKKQTRQAHIDTEHLLILKLKAIKSTTDYAAILKMFYGFFNPLQKQIESFIDEEQLPDVKIRRKSSSLQTDLLHLGLQTGETFCADLPSIKNYMQAFGALYVIEGSTLGGMHIATMLKNNPSIFLQDDVLNFFNGYGEKNWLMWAQFKACLQEHIGSEEQLQQVIEAANETFMKLKLWMKNF